MANSRPIETKDVGQILIELLKAHSEVAFADEADAYTSEDGPGNVVVETYGVGMEVNSDPSNLILVTDRGEEFAIRVTRIG